MYRRSTKPKLKHLPVKPQFGSRRLMVVFIFGVVIIAVSLAKEVIRKIEIQREISSLESEIADLEQHNTELTAMMAYFNSSTFQEKEARSKLNVVKPGETVVVLPSAGNGDAVTVTAATANSSLALLPNYQKWFNYVFN
jgi:cell division protein FtsB